MPRVTEEHRQAQRERITAAALRAFREHGFGGASMGDVIAESGLSAGAIYGYFKNKDELMAHTAGQLVGERLRMFEALLGRRPLRHPARMARALAESLPGELLSGALLLEIWGAVPRDDVLARVAREQLARITDQMTTYIRDYLVEQGRPAADAGAAAELLAPVYVGLVQGYLVRCAVVGPDAAAPYLAGLDVLADSPL